MSTIAAIPQASSTAPIPARPAFSNLLSKECQVYARTVRNPTFWALAFTTLAVSVCISAAILLPPLAAVAVAVASVGLLALGIYNNREVLLKRLICEVGLIGGHIKGLISSGGKWYSEITPHLTLGGNPLKTQGHDREISDTHHAVLSMIEEHETRPYLSGVPTRPLDWSRRDSITFLNLPNRDYFPVRDADVDQGVAFLHTQISQGKRVYVHCNAGIGRSATIVACYLIKHQNMTPAQAIQYINTRRDIAVTVKSPALVSFVARHNLVPASSAA